MAAAGGEISYPSTCVVRRTMYCAGPTPGTAGVLPANVKVPTTVGWDGRIGFAIFISTYGLRYSRRTYPALAARPSSASGQLAA